MRAWYAAIPLLLQKSPCAAPDILIKGLCDCLCAGFIVFRTRVAMYQCRLVRHSSDFNCLTALQGTCKSLQLPDSVCRAAPS